MTPILEAKTIEGLKWIIKILDQKNIPYQIVGGLAAKLYGSTREINDIDIDMPEENFKDVLDEVSPYIVSGPKHFVDDKWDMQILILNYKGQEIELGGAYETKIRNKEETAWIDSPADLSNTNKIEFEDMTLNVCPPERMIEYKQHLNGDHQVQDIEAMKKYIETTA